MSAINVIWYQGAGCSGCSVSVLNAVSPNIKEILLFELAPGKSINLLFHPTVMAAGGELSAKILKDAPKNPGYVLILEGALPKGQNYPPGVPAKRNTAGHVGHCSLRLCRREQTQIVMGHRGNSKTGRHVEVWHAAPARRSPPGSPSSGSCPGSPHRPAPAGAASSS